MQWTVEIGASQIKMLKSKADQVVLAKRIFKVLRRHDVPDALRGAHVLVIACKPLWLYDRVAVLDVCAVLQEDSIGYQIHKVERVDSDFFAHETRQAAATLA